jgi:hypothetical protein
VVNGNEISGKGLRYRKMQELAQESLQAILRLAQPTRAEIATDEGLAPRGRAS